MSTTREFRNPSTAHTNYCSYDCGEHGANTAIPPTGHTATPWRVYNNQIQGFPNGDLQRKIIAEVTKDAEITTNEANARFVVKAVNSHDALVAVLRALVQNVDISTIRPGKRNEAKWGELAQAARTVLASIGDK